MLISHEAAPSIAHRRSERDTSIREARGLRERAWVARAIDLLMREAAEPTRLRSRYPAAEQAAHRRPGRRLRVRRTTR
jgi:hypothetical protein